MSALHQGLYQKSTIMNPQVVLGTEDFGVSLCVRPVLERRTVVSSRYLVTLWVT